MMKRLVAFLGRNAWIFVVLAFALLIAAWTALIVISNHHRPQPIEVTRPR